MPTGAPETVPLEVIESGLYPDVSVNVALTLLLIVFDIYPLQRGRRENSSSCNKDTPGKPRRTSVRMTRLSGRAA
jgi:hypothetical protein